MRSIQQWGREGICRRGGNLDPDMFTDPKRSKEAKKHCQTCPVMVECFQYALIHNERGLWGGTGDLERSNYAKLNEPVIKGLIQEAMSQGLLEHR